MFYNCGYDSNVGRVERGIDLYWELWKICGGFEWGRLTGGGVGGGEVVEKSNGIKRFTKVKELVVFRDRLGFLNDI